MAPGTLGMEAVDLGGTYSVTTYCSVAYKKFSVRWGGGLSTIMATDRINGASFFDHLVRGVIRERLAGCPPPPRPSEQNNRTTPQAAHAFLACAASACFKKRNGHAILKNTADNPRSAGRCSRTRSRPGGEFLQPGGGARIRDGGGGPRFPDDAGRAPVAGKSS